MVAYAFNAQQVQPQYGGSGGLPVGASGEPQKYKVIIAGTEGKPTKDGKGSYAQLTLKCVEGPFNGVTQFDNLNLFNLSPQAVEIANKQLSAYCHVVGKFAISDLDELCNIPFWVEIRRQKNNPEYTEVGAIFDINGNEPGKAGAGPVQAAAAPPPLQPPAGVGPQGGFQPPQGQPGFPTQGQPQAQPPAAPPQGWAGGPPQGQPGQPGPAYGAPAGFPQQQPAQQQAQPAQTFQPPQGGPPAGWAGGPAAGGPGNGWPGQ